MSGSVVGTRSPCREPSVARLADRRAALLKRLGLPPCPADAPAHSPLPKRESRRLGLLKRMGLFAENPEVEIARAVTVENLSEAFRLVHDVFVQEHYIRPQESGMRIRAYEALPSTATFVALLRDQVVGVQSLVLDDTELGVPSDESFRQELDAIRGPGRRLCEATNEAVVEACRRSPVPTELMRCMFAQALASGCHELITTVSPGHAKFYVLLGFEQISPVRSYSRELNDPVVVLRMPLDRMRERVAGIISRGDADDEAFLKSYYIDENPYLSFIEEWASDAEAAFRDTSLLRDLFVDRGQVLPWCTDQEREAVRRAWGEDLYQAVLTPALPISTAARAEAKVSGKWRTSRSAELPGQPVPADERPAVRKIA